MTAKMNGTPIAAGKACDCQIYYGYLGSVCEEICGDGVLLLINDPKTCDDGNLVDDDGCSSSCQSKTISAAQIPMSILPLSAYSAESRLS